MTISTPNCTTNQAAELQTALLQAITGLTQLAGSPESLSSSPLALPLLPGLLLEPARSRCTRALLLPLISAPTPI
jgi:hypothetical protein